MLLQKVRILSNERLDLQDFNNLQEFGCADWQAYTKNVLSNQNFVLSGFNATGVSTKILTIAVANSSLILGQSRGTLFIGAPSMPALTTNGLTSSATNFIELSIDEDTGGADSRAFWDPTAAGGLGAEFSQIVDTFIFLKATLNISTSNFSGDSTRVRICEVDVDSGGTITAIRDKRDLFYRLGTGNNVLNSYSWSSRTEPVNTQFTGADKDIKSFKEWMNATMSSIQEIKGTTYWYEANPINLETGFRNASLSILTGATATAKLVWDGSNLQITDDNVSPLGSDVVANLRLLDTSSNLYLTRETISISNDQILWVELPTVGNNTTYEGVGVTSSNYRVSNRGAVPLNASTYWIAYREGSKLYVRSAGELETGETLQVSDSTPSSLTQFLGFNPETATSIPYTTLLNPAYFATTFGIGSSLTTAVSVLALNMNAIGAVLDTNVYDENYAVVAPITSGSNLTLPLDSRNGNAVRNYIVGDGLLQVFLNGQMLQLGSDWTEVGSSGNPSNQIQIQQDLVVGDSLIYRIDTTGGFNVGGSGSGEANTASNIGAGSGVFASKVGVDLQFKSLVAGTNISITPGVNTLTISAATVAAPILNTLAVSGNYTALSTDDVLLVNASSGAITIALPTAASVPGKVYYIKKTDSTSNTVIIDPFSSQTIDGATSVSTIVQYTSFTIVCDGTSWYLI